MPRNTNEKRISMIFSEMPYTRPDFDALFLLVLEKKKGLKDAIKKRLFV